MTSSHQMTQPKSVSYDEFYQRKRFLVLGKSKDLDSATKLPLDRAIGEAANEPFLENEG